MPLPSMRLPTTFAPVTGREAEDYETIARRYVSDNPEATPRLATQFKLMMVMLISMLRPAPKTVPIPRAS